MTVAIILIVIGLVLLIVDGIVNRRFARLLIAFCIALLIAVLTLPLILNVTYRDIISMIFGK